MTPAAIPPIQISAAVAASPAFLKLAGLTTDSCLMRPKLLPDGAINLERVGLQDHQHRNEDDQHPVDGAPVADAAVGAGKQRGQQRSLQDARGGVDQKARSHDALGQAEGRAQLAQDQRCIQERLRTRVLNKQ